MNKKKTSLKLAKRSVSDKVEYARSIVAAMTGNLKFPTPSPSLSAVSSAATNLENAIAAAMDGGRSKTAAMHAKEKLLDDLLTQLAHYVDSISNGDESIILSSGINSSADRIAPQLPEAPVNLSSAIGKDEGIIDLKWGKVKGARIYVVEQCDNVADLQNRAVGSTTPALNVMWKQIGLITKTKLTITGLTSGLKYAFRVYAIGTGGNGGYSDVLVAKAF